MKVIQLISSSGFFGSESVVLELSKALRSLGVENVIGILENLGEPRGGLADEAFRNGLKVERFPCRGKLDMKTLGILRKRVHGGGFDILHSHGYKADIYACLGTVGVDLKLVSTCHNWIGVGMRMEAYYWIQKKVLRGFDRVVAVSDNVFQELARIGVAKEKRTTIQNGIDLSAFDKGRSIKLDLGLRETDFVIGSVGRLSAEKGLGDMLRVAERVCKVYDHAFFLVVGEGPLQQELEDRSRELGLENRVIFTGQRRDMANVYKTLDLLLLPSYTEGLPMAILEAMASSLPVVASGVGGVPDLIEDGKSGILLRPGDVDGFSNSIMRLIENETEARELGKEGHEVAREGFSAGRMASDYVEAYKSVAGEGRG